MQGRAFLSGILLLAAAFTATRLGLRPPAARPASAPAGAFSADRAMARLREVLDAAGDGVPHPVGSEANARVRERILAGLRDVGLSPTVTESLTCGRYLDCTPIANVTARVPGRGGGAPVLLAVHYDSVPAGPGAADDGSGVAIVLEIARALVAEPAQADVILLLDDGEESGLGGAVAFLEGPLAGQVGAVVNLEARGTGGPSLLFETAGPGAAVVRHLAEGAPRPVGSSLLSTVYGLLPNDTDLTVLRRLGVPGANLAFIDGAIRYHTPRDDLAHLDPRTVQQQGENALALVRGLAGAGAGADDRGQVVWFDLLGLRVVRYPEQAALPLAIAALLLAAGLAVAGVRRRRSSAGRVALGALALPLGAAVAAGLGLGAARALGLDPIFRPWVATPAPLVTAFFLSGIAGAGGAAVVLAGPAGPAGLRDGIRFTLAVLAVGLAAILPGTSYLLLAPAAIGGVVGIGAMLTDNERWREACDLATMLAAALVLLPPAWLLYPALGHAAGPAAAAAVALVALPLAPLVAGRSRATSLAVVGAPGLLALAALGISLSLPVADADAPERVVVYFHQDAATGRARVLAHSDLGRLPAPLRAAAPFSDAPRIAFGWGALRPSFEAEAAPLPVPGPEVALLEATRSGEVVRARLRASSPRGAPEIQIALPSSVEVRGFSFEGIPVARPVPKIARWYGGWWLYRLPAWPGGIEVSLEVASPGPFEIVVADQSPGLPPAVRAVADARPPWAVTQQEGDVTLFTRTLRIEAKPAGAD
jgi:hypothetical protein